MTTFVLLSKVTPTATGQTSELSEMDAIFEEELSPELFEEFKQVTRDVNRIQIAHR